LATPVRFAPSLKLEPVSSPDTARQPSEIARYHIALVAPRIMADGRFKNRLNNVVVT